jgi:phage terminase large subunit-like protein
MITNTIQTIEHLPVKLVHAKQGKELRAEPVAALSSQGKDHHVGNFPALEGELTRWVPGSKMPSPNRMDAKVYAILELDPTISKPRGTLRSKPRNYV